MEPKISFRGGLSALIKKNFILKWNILSSWDKTLKSSSEGVWLHNNKWYFIGPLLGFTFLLVKCGKVKCLPDLTTQCLTVSA